MDAYHRRTVAPRTNLQCFACVAQLVERLKVRYRNSVERHRKLCLTFLYDSRFRRGT